MLKLAFVLAIFWLVTAFNFNGTSWTARLATIGLIGGVSIPAFILIGLAIAYIALLKDVIKSDQDPLTFVEKCMRGEIKPERGVEWNTSGNFLKRFLKVVVSLGFLNF